MPRYNEYDYSLLESVITVEKDCDFSPIDFDKSHSNIVVEIGCGNGHFLTNIAMNDANSQYIGIDIKKERLIRCIQKKIANNIDNIYILGDAFVVLDKKFNDNSVNKMFMTFPDPWPKMRHHKNRLFKKEFLDIVYKKLIPDGKFVFITDFEEYFLSSRALVEQDSRFVIDTSASDVDYLTKSLFGEKWEKEGRNFYLLEFYSKCR